MRQRLRCKAGIVVTAGMLAVLLGASAAGAADTSAGEKLFQSNDCTTCHAVDHQVVGPALVDVAKKFAGQKDAEATLVDAVKNGHVGTWGQVPMPPHPTLTDDQIKQIVEWILTLK